MSLPNNILKCMVPADRKSLGKSGLTIEEADAKGQKRAERELHETFGQWLRLHGLSSRHDRMDRKTNCAPGWPDFDVPYGGKACLIEFKAEGGLLSEVQRACHLHLKEFNKTDVLVTAKVAEAIAYFCEKTGFNANL